MRPAGDFHLIRQTVRQVPVGSLVKSHDGLPFDAFIIGVIKDAKDCGKNGYYKNHVNQNKPSS